MGALFAPSILARGRGWGWSRPARPGTPHGNQCIAAERANLEHARYGGVIIGGSDRIFHPDCISELALPHYVRRRILDRAVHGSVHVRTGTGSGVLLGGLALLSPPPLEGASRLTPSGACATC
jgi:hypothetical protein